MAKATYSISQAQSALPRLVRDAEDGGLIGISRRDETVAYLLSRQQLEAIVETMELLANPEAQKAVEGHRAGRTRFQSVAVLDED